MNGLTPPALNHDICPIHPEDGSISSLTKRHHLFIQNPETQQSSKNTNSLSADKVYDLFHLVPQPSAPVGLRVPTADELDLHSRPVPQQLIETQVDWHRYSFYNGHGN